MHEPSNGSLVLQFVHHLEDFLAELLFRLPSLLLLIGGAGDSRCDGGCSSHPHGKRGAWPLAAGGLRFESRNYFARKNQIDVSLHCGGARSESDAGANQLIAFLDALEIALHDERVRRRRLSRGAARDELPGFAQLLH